VAAPSRTPAQIAQLIHDSAVGASVAGWTLAGKDVTVTETGRLIVEATVTRQANAWTALYTTQVDGGLGKVYYVLDGQGRRWGRDGNSWADRGDS
jgi:hypothetical protein